MNKVLLIFCFLPLSVLAATDLIVTNHPECTKMGKYYMDHFNVTPPELAIILTTCEGIVNPQYSGLGGGFIATVFNGNCKKSVVINAREKSPAVYTYNVAGRLNKIGVPAMLDGYKKLYDLDLCGVKPKLEWSQLFGKNYDLAVKGWQAIPTNKKFVQLLKEIEPRPLNRPIVLSNDGSMMKNPILAETLKRIAHEPSPIGYLTTAMYNDFHESGSIIKAQDFATPRVNVSPPGLTAKFRSYTIAASTFPGSGVTFLLGAKIVDAAFDQLKELSSEDRMLFMYHTLRYMYSLKPFLNSPHVKLSEVLKNSRKIAEDILSKLHQKWDHTVIRKFGAYSINIPNVRHKREAGTANIVIRRGKYAITMTSTINNYYGSKFFSMRLGFPYNDQLNDFDDEGSANAPRPSTAPQSATSAMVFYTSKWNPVFQIGAAGGSKMIGAIFNTFFNYFVNGWSLEKSNKASRCTPQYKGLEEVAVCEKGIKNAIKKKFENYKMNVTIIGDGFGGVTASSTVKSRPEAVYDTRRGGAAYIMNHSQGSNRQTQSRSNTERAQTTTPPIRTTQATRAPTTTTTQRNLAQRAYDSFVSTANRAYDSLNNMWTGTSNQGGTSSVNIGPQFG